jgi:hypothetical protein
VKANRVVRRRGSHIFPANRLTDGAKIVSLTQYIFLYVKKNENNELGSFMCIRVKYQQLRKYNLLVIGCRK